MNRYWIIRVSSQSIYSFNGYLSMTGQIVSYIESARKFYVYTKVAKMCNTMNKTYMERSGFNQYEVVDSDQLLIESTLES